jgi:hypothetical protein
MLSPGTSLAHHLDRYQAAGQAGEVMHAMGGDARASSQTESGWCLDWLNHEN